MGVCGVGVESLWAMSSCSEGMEGRFSGGCLGPCPSGHRVPGSCVKGPVMVQGRRSGTEAGLGAQGGAGAGVGAWPVPILPGFMFGLFGPQPLSQFFSRLKAEP